MRWKMRWSVGSLLSAKRKRQSPRGGRSIMRLCPAGSHSIQGIRESQRERCHDARHHYWHTATTSYPIRCLIAKDQERANLRVEKDCEKSSGNAKFTGRSSLLPLTKQLQRTAPVKKRTNGRSGRLEKALWTSFRLLCKLRQPRLDVNLPKTEVPVDAHYRHWILLHRAGACSRRGHLVHLALAHFQECRQFIHG